MKVEFIESEFWGAALLVAEADFKLAKARDAEFDSLAHATTAFANMFNVDYTIERNEYKAALDVLEKNGAVIFTIGSSQYSERRWVEIQVSNNNQPQRVLYADEDGYHLIRHAHFNSIQKRLQPYKSGTRRNERNDKYSLRKRISAFHHGQALTRQRLYRPQGDKL